MAKLNILVVALCVFELIAVSYQCNQTEVNYFTRKFVDVLNSTKSANDILAGLRQVCETEAKQCAQNKLANMDTSTAAAAIVSQEVIPALINFTCSPPNCMIKNITMLVKGTDIPKCYIQIIADNLARGVSYVCDLAAESARKVNSDK